MFADQPPKLCGKLMTLLLCQKFANLVAPAVRLDDELAAMEGRFRAAV